MRYGLQSFHCPKCHTKYDCVLSPDCSECGYTFSGKPIAPKVDLGDGLSVLMPGPDTYESENPMDISGKSIDTDDVGPGGVKPYSEDE